MEVILLLTIQSQYTSTYTALDEDSLMPVVPFTQRTAQSQPIPKVDPTFLMMAAAELHEAGRLVEPEPEAQVMEVSNKGPQGTVRPVPIRSQASLDRAIRDAEGDDDLAAIRKRLEKRGYDSSSVR